MSGPIERLSRAPGRLFAPAVLAAGERLTEALRRANAAEGVGPEMHRAASTPRAAPAPRGGRHRRKLP